VPCHTPSPSGASGPTNPVVDQGFERSTAEFEERASRLVTWNQATSRLRPTAIPRPRSSWSSARNSRPYVWR
jgi:hypothetical protein